MSFIVSVQGQFKSYELPDFSNARKDKVVAPNDINEFEKIQKEELKKSPLPRPDLPPSEGVKNYQQNIEKFQQQKNKIYAKDIMSSPVKTLKVDNKIQQAQDFFTKYQFRHLPIVKKELVVGIISDRDILRHQASHTSLTENLESIMTREVLCAYDYTRIQDLARIMLHEGFSALPILDQQNFMLGIVTQTDILKSVQQKALL